MKSSLLSRIPGIDHGFGDARTPVASPLEVRFEERSPVWKQVHGIAIADVNHATQTCGEVDGLFSFERDVVVSVRTADCVPILLARKDGGAVAAVHAGWRGTHARILTALWEKLKARGEKPSDWVAAIGPAIGPCCYEVSPELAEDFEKEHGGKLAVPSPRMLDLPAVNAAELRDIGMRAEDVEILRACTRCTQDAEGHVFHSYRREGKGTRQYSAICRT